MPDLRQYDGYGDSVHKVAAAILDQALEDERGCGNSPQISPTLACFIECRIAATLRQLKAMDE